MDADTDTDQGGDDSSGDGYSADGGDSDTGDNGDSSDQGGDDYSEDAGDAGSDGTGDYSADGYDSDGQDDGSGGSDDLSGFAADSMGVSDSSDTMTLGEKAHSLALAGGAALYDGYDRVAAVYDMVTGDDAGADRHMEDADAESDSLWRNLRQGFEGKRIEPSLSEKQRIQRMADEA